jgi:UDP-2,3-diacylglucosamine pyrophosphatase LpxH
MRIATFGDLHLGHTPVLDKFQGREELLLRFDDHLSRTHDRIILMGDIYQTDYGVVPGSRSDVLEAIIKRYSRVVRRWESSRYSTIFGNHDLITQKIMGTLKQIRLKKDGWRLWFIHGHQFDPFIGEGRHLPFMVTWLIGGMRRMGLNRVADFLEGPLYDFGQRFFQRLEGAAWKALRHGNNNIIVMGHSHQMACRQLGNGLYVNSGACSWDSMRYISIDTATRLVEVRAFTPPNDYHLFLQWRDVPLVNFGSP